MKTKTIIAIIATFLLMLAAGFSAIFAQDEEEAIKASMKNRYPALTKLKEELKAGETPAGFVEAVKEEFAKNAEIKKVIDGENADREKLYSIIAKKTETTPEVVGKNNAMRIFTKAGEEEYFKGKDDKWYQKKEMKK